MSKKINAIFLKSPTAVGYAYAAGTTAELDPKVFEDLKRLKYAREYDPSDEKENIESDLPEDFPGREKLIEAGILLLEDVQGIDDLTSIKGIGDVLAKQIKEFLSE